MIFFKRLFAASLLLAAVLDFSAPLSAMGMRTVYLVSRNNYFINKFIDNTVAALENASALVKEEPKEGLVQSMELINNFANEVFQLPRFDHIQSSVLALLQELVKQEDLKKDIDFCSFVLETAYKLRKSSSAEVQSGVTSLLQELQDVQDTCAICCGEFAYGQDYGKGPNKYEDGESILSVGECYFNCKHLFHEDCFKKEASQKFLILPIVRCPACQSIVKIAFCPELSNRTAKVIKKNAGWKLSLCELNLELRDVRSILSEIDLEKRAKITALYLSTNNLTQLDLGMFDGLINLKELALSQNQLTQFDPDVFNGLPNLKDIYLCGNPLHQQTKEALQRKFAGKVRLHFR